MQVQTTPCHFYWNRIFSICDLYHICVIRVKFLNDINEQLYVGPFLVVQTIKDDNSAISQETSPLKKGGLLHLQIFQLFIIRNSVCIIWLFRLNQGFECPLEDLHHPCFFTFYSYVWSLFIKKKNNSFYLYHGN